VSTCGYMSRGNPDESQGVVREESGEQLVEFAVALPLLIVFVVGIFDFSGAFTLKQKLTNVARDAARAAATEPINDLTSAAVPVSVVDTFWIVDNYLKANEINDCGIGPSNSVKTVPATWTYSRAANGCTGAGLKIIINRGYYFPASSGATIANINCTFQSAGTSTAVLSTCVSIQYGYKWQFGRVASLLGSTAILPNTLTATAVAMNEN
jgi:Flp pilus assembly protein TadG